EAGEAHHFHLRVRQIEWWCWLANLQHKYFCPSKRPIDSNRFCQLWKSCGALFSGGLCRCYLMGALLLPCGCAAVTFGAAQGRYNRRMPDRPRATTLLGGLAPSRFLARYWQRRPLLIRGA